MPIIPFLKKACKVKKKSNNFFIIGQIQIMYLILNKNNLITYYNESYIIVNWFNFAKAKIFTLMKGELEANSGNNYININIFNNEKYHNWINK